MHLALNAYFWNQPHTGSGQYLRQLVYHFNRYVSDLDITLIWPQVAGTPLPTDVPPSVRLHPVPVRPGHVGKVLFEQVLFPRACRAVAAETAHVPYWGAPLRSPVPLIVTIHDVIPLLVPAYQPTAASKLYNALVSASARGANQIITDSHASKKDIVRLLDVPEALVTPIYLGIGPEFTPQDNFLLDMAVRQKYNLPDSYVLYLGGYTLHKNIAKLLLAYTYVAQAMGEDYPLVLAGAKPTAAPPKFPDYEVYIAQLGLEKVVRWVGYIEEADKPVIYRSADTFVFPSRYEGFGFPPLEAMACNVPVVATTAPGVEEVVGDAAMAVDPDDERQMGGAIIATLIQENLAADLRTKGVARAREFTWEKTMAATLEVYGR
jgi:glycosyltransferase involved in cell wall biosynthesis